MIEYITPYPKWPDFRVPRLHSVEYQGERLQINAWLRDNCRAAYYHSPDWMNRRFIQFEDTDDAVLFALRWS